MKNQNQIDILRATPVGSLAMIDNVMLRCLEIKSNNCECAYCYFQSVRIATKATTQSQHTEHEEKEQCPYLNACQSRWRSDRKSIRFFKVADIDVNDKPIKQKMK